MRKVILKICDPTYYQSTFPNYKRQLSEGKDALEAYLQALLYHQTAKKILEALSALKGQAMLETALTAKTELQAVREAGISQGKK